MHPTPALDQHHDFLALRPRAIDPIVSRHRAGRFIKFQRVRPRVHVVDVRAPTPETRSSQSGDDGGDVEHGVLLFRHHSRDANEDRRLRRRPRDDARSTHRDAARGSRSIAREDSTMRCARRTRARRTGEDERAATMARARGREKDAGDARDGGRCRSNDRRGARVILRMRREDARVVVNEGLARRWDVDR